MCQKWKVLGSPEDYDRALKRQWEIGYAAEGTPERDEAELLKVLIKEYEDRRETKLAQKDPLLAIRQRMKELGYRPMDLEGIIGSKGHVSSVLSGRRELTLKMARRLKALLHLPAEVFLGPDDRCHKIGQPAAEDS